MSTGKVLTILGTLMALAGVVLMAIGAAMPTFAFYGVLTLVGIGVAGLGKKMEDREADARFNNRV
jgi:membrane-bound ClpP family serine protease